MKETDYIAATNLAKIRIAKQVLESMTFPAPEEEGNMSRIIGLLIDIEAAWNRRVKS